MEANKVTLSHKPPSDGGMVKEEFIRVGTTLYKISILSGEEQTLRWKQRIPSM